MWTSVKNNPDKDGTYLVLAGTGGAIFRKFENGAWHGKFADSIEYWQAIEPRPTESENEEAPYLNTDMKQKIVMLMAFQNWIEQICGEPMRHGDTVKPELLNVRDKLQAVTDYLFSDIDMDQRLGVRRTALCSSFRVVQRETALKEDWIIVDQDDANLLGTMAVENHECTFCTANKYEVKRCELRKCLLRVGSTMPESTLDCPFKGVM